MKKLGSLNEKLAADYLVTNSYKIFSQNKKISSIEIDIIAIGPKQNEIYFYEVKSVKRKNFIQGFFPFSFQQWTRYVNAVQWAQTYLFPQENIFIGLIVLDEYKKILYFDPHFHYYQTK